MMPSGVPLEALREVQEGLTNNMWMLGLPELAPFRSFIMDAAAQCEAGTIERALRDVRREAKEEREEQHRQGANDLSPAAEARAIEEVVRTRATAVLPKRSHDAPQSSLSGATRPRSFSQAQLLAFGPTIHLVRAAVYPDLTRGLKVTHRKPHRRPRLMAAPPPTRAASRPSDPPPLSHPPHQHPTLPPKHTPPTRPARRGASWTPSSSSCRSGWWTSLGRCMGGVAQWPTKHGVLHGTKPGVAMLQGAKLRAGFTGAAVRGLQPMWNSARQVDVSHASTLDQ